MPKAKDKPDVPEDDLAEQNALAAEAAAARAQATAAEARAGADATHAGATREEANEAAAAARDKVLADFAKEHPEMTPAGEAPAPGETDQGSSSKPVA